MTALTGRVALVTGGSRGIGRAIALRLAGDGADVALTYAAAADRAHGVVAEIEAGGRRGLAIQADLTGTGAAAEAVAATVARFGRLDILVNNAGVFHGGAPEEASIEAVDETLNLHVRAVFLAVRAAIPHLGEGGRIISIGSSFAERVPYPGVSLYSMSKSALIGLTRGLARDLGPRGVTANLVHPGSTDTEMNPADGEDADLERSFTALGRYNSPEDVAHTVAHLAGPGGRNITGASIAVDAGVTA